jgi:hypothetical protein
MTFRIEESVMQQLKAESEKKEISLNTLVNQILKRFVDWDMYEPRVGMIPIAKPIVSALFEIAPHEKIAELAQKVGKNAVHDITLFMKSKVDLDSFLSWFEMRMKSSSIELSHTVESDLHTYILKHDLGYNWSLYHKTLLELIFNDVLSKRVDVAITNTTLTFKFTTDYPRSR